MKAKYRVQIVEHEAGWGEDVIGQRDFDTHEEAAKFQCEYNTKEPTMGHKSAPPQYFKAHDPVLIDLDKQP